MVVRSAGTVFGQQGARSVRHALSHARERGVNFYDTSELYPVPPNPQLRASVPQYLGSWLASAS
jgi:aryl-alcohol dehydrogenase-like predicted oxidoreductase